MPVPLVSIVIPCYNSERWIAEAIQSALVQTWPEKEVIIVDDGSTDQSLEIIKGFGTAVRWASGPNRGGCAARNTGIEMARGEWIQFLDADDLLLDTCVASKMEAGPTLQNTPCCRVEPLDRISIEQLPPHWRRQSYSFEEILAHGSPQTSSPLHAKSNLNKVGGFREGLPCSQEFDLHLRLSIVCGVRFVHMDKTGVLIRPTPGSVGRSAGARMPRTIAKVLFDALSLIAETGADPQPYRPIVARRATYLARWLYRKGEREEALLLAQRARALDPSWYRGQYQSILAETLARIVGFRVFEKLHGALRGRSVR